MKASRRAVTTRYLLINVGIDIRLALGCEA
jgi:hypothetical protein